MKKHSVFLFFIFSFFSCSSTKFNFANYNSVAVIGMRANSNLSEKVDTVFVRSDKEDEDDTGALTAIIDKFFYGEDPERLTAQDRIDYAYETMQHALEEIAGLSVVSKDEIINSEQYENSITGNPLDFMDTVISVSGFEKKLYSIGSKKARLLMSELNCDSLVSAEFMFIKLLADESKVNTTVQAKVIMNVIVYDSNGKKTIIDSFEAVSFEKLPVKKFKYDKDALVEMYPSLIETVVNKFVLAYLN